MAIHAPITGAPLRAPAIAFHVLPRRTRRLLATIERDEIGDAIEVLIARLDRFDGDPDCETTGIEDDFIRHSADGPGCPLADSDHCDAHDDNPYRLFGDGAAGDPDDAEDEHDREAVNEDGSDNVMPTLPKYGIDQSEGPVNEHEAYRAWQLSQYEGHDEDQYRDFRARSIAEVTN